MRPAWGRGAFEFCRRPDIDEPTHDRAPPGQARYQQRTPVCAAGDSHLDPDSSTEIIAGSGKAILGAVAHDLLYSSASRLRSTRLYTSYILLSRPLPPLPSIELAKNV
jgi:hypothetical protein